MQEQTEIEIELNGKTRRFPEGCTVAGMLETVPHPGAFAVEVDGTIIPRPAFESTVLRNGSVVEIVHFVGGG